MATPQLAKKSKDGSRPGYGGIWEWITETALPAAKKYAPLIKTGVAALSTYAAWKDQQKKNEMQQGAYEDYMAQAEAAGHEAQAAIDVNLTPMTVSGVPTTKADVTDFTAVAARGGLMSIPTKQRKRYAKGPNEFEVEEMDEEILTPYDFKMEGVDIGEQVFYDTGKGDRANAMQIWGQMENPDKAIFDFDFEIFFMDGGWSDQIKSEVEVGTETQMASAPNGAPFMMEEFLQAVQEGFTGSYDEYIDQIDRSPADYGQAPSAEGIMQAAKGGRIGYEEAGPVMSLEDKILWLMKQGHSFDDAKKMAREGTTNFPTNEAKGGRIGYQEGIGPNQGSPSIMAEAITDSEVEAAYGVSVGDEVLQRHIRKIAEQSASPEDFPATDSDFLALEVLSEQTDVPLEEIIKVATTTNFTTPEQSKGEIYANYMARGGRPGYATQGFVGSTPEEGDMEFEKEIIHPGTLDEGNIGMPGQPTTEFEHEGAIAEDDSLLQKIIKIAGSVPTPFNPYLVYKLVKEGGVGIMEAIEIVKNKTGKWPLRRPDEEVTENEPPEWAQDFLDKVNKGEAEWPKPDYPNEMRPLNAAHGGRIKKAPGGIMDLGGLEKDYRTTGGFVPLGGRERADDVPARLSKNEFVMTADAVRAAGGGSINRGAQRMYDTMKHLEANPQSRRMTA